MVAPLEASVVRIYSKSGKLVGAGFLISSKYVLTCAHVVTDALGLARKTAEKPDLEISLDFPLLAAKQLFAAKVIFWRPENPNEQFEDIAGLELANSPLDSAKPAQLVTSEDFWEHPFRVLGFPAGQPNGVSSAGVLRGRTANGWVHLEDVKQPGYRLEPGFSGAPVWDEKLQGVAGMAVAAEMNRPEVKAAFMIPANVLIEAWPELGKQAISACPYRGLSAFREEHEKFFFGRQKFVHSLVEVVYRQPLVAVIGASGSGKSSVVFAGLIPKLREKGNWLIESFRPQNQPFFGLASALVRLLKPDLDEIQQPGRAAELVADLKGKLTLPQVMASILARYPGKRLLLVIDQFEELYNPRNDSEQQPFVDALLAAIQSATNDLTVVLTLRADFLSYLLNYPTFGAALQQHKPEFLGAMNREEMQEAIERPAAEMGVKLEEGLTERILDAVKREPGNLPLLEFALEQLWRRQKNNRLTHDAYDDIKGVEKALARYAQSVYEELTQKNDGKQIQQIFIQLVRVGEGTEDTRQLATRAEVGADNWDLVTQLADKRLVVTGRNEATGEETVEVVHEALIWEWGLLRQWIDENRKKLIQKREIEDAAKRWRDRGKAKDYLLGGKVLTEAKVFQKQEGGNLKLSDLGKEFIEESLRDRRIGTLRTASLFTIPLFVAFVAAIPFWRRAAEQTAWETIRTRGVGTREALELLTEGCQERKSLQWIPDYLANLLFGKCANLFGAKLGGANLIGANLIDVPLPVTNLSGAFLNGANLKNASLSLSSLNGASLTTAKLNSADFRLAELRLADLCLADLIGADLSGADLSGADFRRANLSGADFSNANLSCISIKDERHCTNFTGAENLTPEQVKSAKNWQQAIYDEEFRKKLGLK